MLICGLPNILFPRTSGFGHGLCGRDLGAHLAEFSGLSQNSLFELGDVFRHPSAAIVFLLECILKVFYGVEGGHSWWIVVFGDIADSFIFQELLGCICIVGRRQIRLEVVPMITVLSPDEWNDLQTENCTVDLVVHGVASWDSFKICCWFIVTLASVFVST